MTNREAIEIISRPFSMQEVPKEILDAHRLAISALEFRERYDNFWEEVKAAGMKGKETEIRHSGRVFRIREVAQ